MSNHKGHVIGGFVAYGIMLASVGIYSFLYQDVTLLWSKERTLLAQIPLFLIDIEYTFHHYFPLLISACSGLISYAWPIILIGIEWFFFAIGGAMFPDIDIKSTSQKYIYAIVFLGLIALFGKKKFYTVACVGIISMIPVFSNHRGLFHRTWFVILLPLATWYWLSIGSSASASTYLLCNTLFFIAGALSHLWLDMGKEMFRLKL